MKGLDADHFLHGHGKSYLGQQAAVVSGWIEAIKGTIEQDWSLEESIEKLDPSDPFPIERGMQALSWHNLEGLLHGFMKWRRQSHYKAKFSYFKFLVGIGEKAELSTLKMMCLSATGSLTPSAELH